MFTTAQLFVRPSIEGETQNFTHSFIQSNNFIEGKLKDEQINNSTNDLLLNWDSTYSADEFPPCKGFDGLSVDWETNQSILNNKFLKVPFIKELVDAFEEMFPYLTFDMVWLFHKKEPGARFQKWCKDFKLGLKITFTIVVNLACVNKSATYKSQEEHIDLTEMNEKSPWENAIKKKNQQHAINAVKSIKWRGKTAIKAGASPGAVVSLKVDY